MKTKHNDYYVYIHRRNDTNDVFYVGKGRGYRAKSKEGRNVWWKAVANKHGFKVEYVEKSMSEESAYDLEAEVVKFYLECGYKLCNLAPGGKGGAGGMPKSEETRKRMSLGARKSKTVAVECSNGMKFDSMIEAATWCQGGENVERIVRGISDCCAGRAKTAFGYSWWKISKKDAEAQQATCYAEVIVPEYEFVFTPYMDGGKKRKTTSVTI